MFSSEIREISKNTYFEEHLRTTASVVWVVWVHKSLMLVEKNGRSRNSGAGGINDSMNFLYDSMKFYLWF